MLQVVTFILNRQNLFFHTVISETTPVCVRDPQLFLSLPSTRKMIENSCSSIWREVFTGGLDFTDSDFLDFLVFHFDFRIGDVFDARNRKGCRNTMFIWKTCLTLGFIIITQLLATSSFSAAMDYSGKEPPTMNWYLLVFCRSANIVSFSYQYS